MLDVVSAALEGGVDAVQLREKDLSGAALHELACRLRDVTRRSGALLLINDRIDIALTCEADGVHLPADSFAPADARRLLGQNRLIGVSTHGIGQAQAAAAGGADFIVFGPVFETPAKRAFGAPVGLDALARAAQAVTQPVLAIGGVRPDRVASVLEHGARGVAVVAAILEADDPRVAAAELRAALG